MELNKINSLVELFFEKYEEISTSSDQEFLKWLKDNQKKFLTWKEVEIKVKALSEYLKKAYLKGIDVFCYLKIDRNG